MYKPFGFCRSVGRVQFDFVVFAPPLAFFAPLAGNPNSFTSCLVCSRLLVTPFWTEAFNFPSTIFQTDSYP
ncbi:MAG: hypothetical protein ACLSG5_15960 [Oscillospiraceae bacterium]